MTNLERSIFSALCEAPIIDPHTHLNPHQPEAQSLDEILCYHYYTELAHSVGIRTADLDAQQPPRERCQAVLRRCDRFAHTVQFRWFAEIVEDLLGWPADRLNEVNADELYDAARLRLQADDYPAHARSRARLEAAILTNEFDEPLNGIDHKRYIPCLRADTIIFRQQDATVRDRLQQATGLSVQSPKQLREVLGIIVARFVEHGAKACAASLPPDFDPLKHDPFLALVDLCREFKLPCCLFIGVRRNLYKHGVFQGCDLFDQRVSLYNYHGLFNLYPDVVFSITVLSSSLQQELAAYAWIYPNVYCFGHWWYSSVPALIEQDLRLRLQCVPAAKLIGFFSDAYKLEFIRPKFNMFRRILAKLLATEYVNPGILTESAAVKLGHRLLRQNAQEIFQIDSTIMSA